MKCSFCKRDIDSKEIFWQKVSGYEKRRRAGGTNHLALRETHQEFVCNGCMTLQLSGINPDHLSLI